MPQDHGGESDVIIIGKKKCPPIRKHFTDLDEGIKWARAQKCPPPCQNNGLMVIGADGDYEAIVFCN
jgi:hypothetical protein